MDADITIIGAGVIGLAIASELSDNRRNVYVIEKNRYHGMGISSRNSEVIHAGIYYPPRSLKSILCIEGRRLLYETCLKHNIPHRKTGKLIIATCDDEMDEVSRLMQNALESGVESLSLLDRTAINRMEPNIRAAGGLHSRETGIISAHALMDLYFHTARMNGCEIVCDTGVTGISEAGGGYRIETVSGSGDMFGFTTEKVVNAAGLHCDTISKMIGKHYELHYCKGDYFSIAGGERHGAEAGVSCA